MSDTNLAKIVSSKVDTRPSIATYLTETLDPIYQNASQLTLHFITPAD
ncbi:hypothetical protein [Pseudoalteromonas obscura]|nr:hypothetical protein [Pseudoalteromonas sp. P94(2023)]